MRDSRLSGRKRLRPWLLPWAATIAGLGCGDPARPTAGGLAITTATSGSVLDADGYALTIDAGPEVPIGANATLQRDDLDAGDHSVGLNGVAANCALDGENPRAVTITEGQKATLTFAVQCSAANTWATMRSMPAPARFRMAAGTINNVIYVVGGVPFRDVSPYAVTNVDAYDVATDTWFPRAIVPGGLAHMNGASVIAGKLYVTGGYDADNTNLGSLLVYDPVADLWVQKADMPVVSKAGAQGVIGGFLYVYVPIVQALPPHFFRYDPATDAWVELASPPHGHFGGVGEAINGKFYLVGGLSDESPRPTTDILDVYDPVTDSWTTKASMSESRAAESGVINGKLYVAGGDSRTPCCSTLEAYDPATDTWTIKASMPTAQPAAVGAVANGKLFVMGGYLQFDRDDGLVQAYTP